jgi:hypothetical protein
MRPNRSFLESATLQKGRSEPRVVLCGDCLCLLLSHLRLCLQPIV